MSTALFKGTDDCKCLQLIQGLSKPKVVNGHEITGPELADLIERMVAALNSRDIPTAGSILEHFNKDLIQKVTAGIVALWQTTLHS